MEQRKVKAGKKQSEVDAEIDAWREKHRKRRMIPFIIFGAVLVIVFIFITLTNIFSSDPPDSGIITADQSSSSYRNGTATDSGSGTSEGVSAGLSSTVLGIPLIAWAIILAVWMIVRNSRHW